ncbi:dihydrodipicolinate synthase family protein [Sciscionella sediminilitoris]|uniref:dihydrodipicolinate synthase family protein n=1 Tax=Sciscionella sediminilitoris TaxID=1445613 RepID=UPI0004DED214|nr:dihydrodipicolinate synthase family protein [Sciscionella sp. SE31]
MFTGLSAFPLTPANEEGIDERAFAGLVTRLAHAGVDSIGALGSTGGYPYFDRAERAAVARTAVEHAAGIPVMIGIGALRTRDVLALAEDAQQAGAASVLLAPVSYQQLTEDEVFGLYADVAKELSVPLCVYDNPGTTHFTFSDELYARIAELPAVGAIKIPGVPAERAPERIAALRALLPERVAVGVSGDPLAAGGLQAGARLWFSVLGGLLPEPCLALTRAIAGGEPVDELTMRMRPLMDLFQRYGSIRVVAAAAAHLGLTESPALPKPLRELDASARAEVAAAVRMVTA